MAVPDWPDTYGYNLFLYPPTTWFFGPWDIFIEHGHRLLGATVGMIAIALLVALWRSDDRRWMKWLGVVALVAVIFQGVLGGLRVNLNAVDLAKMHGCFAALFFGLTAALCVLTSRRWRETIEGSEHPQARRIHTLTIITACLAYFQLVLGAQLRHVGPSDAPRIFQLFVAFHLLMAVVLGIHVLLLLFRVLSRHRSESALVRPAVMMTVLLMLQLVLGPATWVTRYGWPAMFGDYNWAAHYVVPAQSFAQAGVATAHVAMGSMIFAVSVVAALRSNRLLRGPAQGVGVGFLLAGMAGEV